ncbi:MAG: hypothetical protein DI543_18115, partial [Bradyrhizobium icense]
MLADLLSGLAGRALALLSLALLPIELTGLARLTRPLAGLRGRTGLLLALPAGRGARLLRLTRTVLLPGLTRLLLAGPELTGLAVRPELAG